MPLSTLLSVVRRIVPCLFLTTLLLSSWCNDLFSNETDFSKKIIENDNQIQITNPTLFKIILSYYEEVSDPLQNAESALFKLNNKLLLHLKELNISNNLTSEQVSSIRALLSSLQKNSSNANAINYQEINKFIGNNENNPLKSVLSISPYSYRVDNESQKCYRYLNGIWQRKVPLKHCQVSISELSNSL
ncbi:MAG: hypothetical protein HQK51_08385 [Oligoflexia bacterium]|nr:hypothetical protein [Oligoflexia bacterium]